MSTKWKSMVMPQIFLEISLSFLNECAYSFGELLKLFIYYLNNRSLLTISVVENTNFGIYIFKLSLVSGVIFRPS